MTRWLDYFAELSIAGIGVMLIVASIGCFVTGRPFEGIENLAWGAVAVILAYMTRRNRGYRAVLAGLQTEANRINEALRREKEMAVIAAQGNCPKCNGMLATTISMRCMACASAYQLMPAADGMRLVETDAAPDAGVTKH